MKKTILFFAAVFLVCSIGVQAQFTNGNLGTRSYLGAETIKGRVAQRGGPIEEAIGSPLLNPDWGSGIVSYRDGRMFKDIELQYNLMNNELYFKKAEEVFMFTDTVSAFQVTYSVKDDVKTEKFQAGYPAADKLDNGQFYQVLSEGPKVHFLLHKYVKRIESYHYSEGKKINYFPYEDYYIYDASARTMKKIKKSEDAVIEALPAYTELIKSTVKTQKLKLKNTEDIIRLVELLNK
jgi:hypothetical protein